MILMADSEVNWAAMPLSGVFQAQDGALVLSGGADRAVRAWRRGERPRGMADKRFTFAYIFAAVEPGTDNAFAIDAVFIAVPEAGTWAAGALIGGAPAAANGAGDGQGPARPLRRIAFSLFEARATRAAP